MDASRFDQITRSLVFPLSRRGMLIGLAGVLPTLLRLEWGIPDAAADHKRQKRNEDCPKDQKRCRHRCIREERCCGNNDCPGGQVCCRGSCQACCGQDALCDDGNPCTQDQCTAEGTCLHTPAPDYAICAGTRTDDNDNNYSYCLGGECLPCKRPGQICATVVECCDSADKDDLGAVKCEPHPFAAPLRFCCRGPLGGCQFSGDCCSGICNDNGVCGFDSFSGSD